MFVLARDTTKNIYGSLDKIRTNGSITLRSRLFWHRHFQYSLRPILLKKTKTGKEYKTKIAALNAAISNGS